MSDTGNRILVVEDNEMNRDMLKRRLERRGYEVITADDGLIGLAVAAAESPQLILMDMDLPEIDGWEASRRLKAEEATRAIPIIALTAHAMPADRQRALDAGCDDYETKPIELDRLLAKIGQLLAAREERPSPPAAEPQDPVGGAPALDMECFAALAEQCGWSQKELAERFLRQAGETIEATHGAIESGDAAQVARVAHGGVGPSGACGATGLMELFRRIERAGREERLETAAALLQEARPLFEHARAVLEALD